MLSSCMRASAQLKSKALLWRAGFIETCARLTGIDLDRGTRAFSPRNLANFTDRLSDKD
jgi:hypothetical protein